MTSLPFSLVLAGVLNVGAAAVVLPSGIELERIADETYDPPGIPGEILIIEQTVPVVCSGQVLFTAVTELDIHAAIYAASSEGIEVVANATTPIPGTPDTFLRARGASCAGERILFLGGPGASSVTGVYSSSGGVIEELLPADTTFGPLSFVSFVEARAEPDGGEGFAAVGPIFQLGVGTTDGLIRKPFGPAPPQLLAEGFSTLLPGRAVPPDTLSEPLVRASDVVFRATFPPLGDGGIYRWSPAVGFSLVADNTTFYPDLGSSLAGFEVLTSLEAGVAFSALAAGGAVEVPVLSPAGIALLALLIATGGWWLLCRVPGGRL
jgi:hypothetical protein